MIENIVGLLIYLFMGVIMGIINAWNKKVMFFLTSIGILLSIYWYMSNPVEYSSSFNWWFIPNVIMSVVGMHIGETNYKEVFKK